MRLLIFLIAGFFVLLLVLSGLRRVADADPAAVRKALKWAGIALLAVVFGFLVVRGWLGAAIAGAFTVAAFGLRWAGPVALARGLYNRMKAARGPSPGRTSRVDTARLSVVLDHDTGDLTGRVTAGGYKGADLADLDREALLALLAECRADSDPDSAQVLEAYLDRRLGADWRDGDRAEQRTGADAPAAETGTMSRAEALAILGLGSDAGTDEIAEVHRRLMKHLHPDRGGSAYLAARINQARDVLLGV